MILSNLLSLDGASHVDALPWESFHAVQPTWRKPSKVSYYLLTKRGGSQSSLNLNPQPL